MDLSGKVVAITGAYKGLGASLSEEFAKKGCKLVLGGRNRKELIEFCDKLSQITEVTPVAMDVRKKEDNENFVKAAIDNFGRLDILINNAGVWWVGSLESMTEEDMVTMFETHTFGPMWSTKAAFDVMKTQGNGMIINIGSTAGIDYKSKHPLYGASKSAIVSFSGCVADYMKAANVRMVCFCPGGMKTDIFRHNPGVHNSEQFMEPNKVANHLIDFIQSDSDEWLLVLRRFE